jgi:hypothetical protein
VPLGLDISTLTSKASEADRKTDITAVEAMIILQYTVELIGWEKTNSVPCKDLVVLYNATLSL